MMTGTPTLCKKQDDVICSFTLRQDCSHLTTEIANNYLLLLANGSGVSALACITVSV